MWPLSCLASCESDPATLRHINMHDVIRHMDQRVTAQLTAGGCLARLCQVEVKKRELPDDAVAYSYCKQSSDAGTFTLVIQCLEKAVQVRGTSIFNIVRCRMLKLTLVTVKCRSRRLHNQNCQITCLLGAPCGLTNSRCGICPLKHHRVAVMATAVWCMPFLHFAAYMVACHQVCMWHQRFICDTIRAVMLVSCCLQRRVRAIGLTWAMQQEANILGPQGVRNFWLCVQEPVPWPTEQCVAVDRLIYKLDLLHHTAPDLLVQVVHLQLAPLHGSLPTFTGTTLSFPGNSTS